MFDPYTVITQLHTKYFSFILYHKDPCKDGTDDSCGWSYAKLTEKEINKIKKDKDFHLSAMLDIYKIKWADENRLKLIYLIYTHVKWNLMEKHLNYKDRAYILDLALNEYDPLTIYPENSKDEFSRMWMRIGRLIKTKYRKWWQHPRFHFWHWKIKI